MKLNETLMHWGETDNSDGHGKYNCPPCQSDADRKSYKFGFHSPDGFSKDQEGFEKYRKFFE